MKQVTGTDVSAVPSPPPLFFCRYISCEACHSISDVGTRHLENCPDLQHIVLSYCDKASYYVLYIVTLG